MLYRLEREINRKIISFDQIQICICLGLLIVNIIYAELNLAINEFFLVNFQIYTFLSSVCIFLNVVN